MEQFIINQEVVRLGSTRDYTSGRVGTIIEINQEEKKARVRWFKTKDGKEINRRTWVSFRFITAKNFF